jgi:anti-sigma factor RsiW
MNCNSCNNQLEHYLAGKLDEEIRLQIEEHLAICVDCNESLNIIKVVEGVINEEKKIESNPFLSARVMAAIDEMAQTDKDSVFSVIFGRLLKPALITVSLAASLLLGIVSGSLVRPVDHSEQVPEEIAYLNDSYIESLEFFNEE